MIEFVIFATWREARHNRSAVNGDFKVFCVFRNFPFSQNAKKMQEFHF
jgi:hypothetical protein